jgi:hypothetical protein
VPQRNPSAWAGTGGKQRCCAWSGSRGLPHHLFGTLEAAWPRANAQSFQESDVKLGINPAVVVAAGWGYPTLSLKTPQVLGTHTELATGLAYMPERCCSPRTIHMGYGRMCPMSNTQVDTDEAGLKQWVANREGVPDVSEPIWQLIVDDRYLGDWRDADDAEARDKARQEIWDRYRRLKRLVRDAGGEVVATSRDGQDRESTSLTATLPEGDPIALRAEALCLYWAKLAEAEPRVRQFRKDLLGGGVVSESEARDLMHSAAASRLNSLAADLCSRYPWELKDAAWFVLTGEVPWVPPLTARLKWSGPPRNHGAITITAADWVPKTAVGGFYAELKGELKARYRDPAPTPSLRRLAVFRFVVERSSAVMRRESSEPGGAKDVLAQGLKTPPWRSLQAQWNEQYPQEHEWHYSDHRNLRRDFKKAFEALAGYW